MGGVDFGDGALELFRLIMPIERIRREINGVCPWEQLESTQEDICAHCYRLLPLAMVVELFRGHQRYMGVSLHGTLWA